MTNPQIRRVARKKCAGSGLAPLVAFAQLPTSIGLMLSAIYMSKQTPDSIPLATALLGLVWMFFSGAGAARMGLSVWRGGTAKPADLFAALRNRRLFERTVAVIVWTEAITLIPQYGGAALIKLIQTPWVQLLAQSVLSILSVFLGLAIVLLFYAAELRGEEGLFRMLLRGTGRSLRGVWRILGMQIVVVWWAMFLLVIAVIIAATLLPTATAACLSLMLSVGMWMLIGPKLTVSYAGLSLELFVGPGAAAEALTPEELELSAKAAEAEEDWPSPAQQPENAPTETPEADKPETPAVPNPPRRGEWEDE